MKILAISDMHGNLNDINLEKIDICAVAGDFAELKGGGKWHWYNQKKWIQKKFIPLCEKHQTVDFCLVPGNHDFCLDKSKTRMHPDLNFKIQWPENVHLLIDRYIELRGLTIYGTPYVPIISYRWAFESEHSELIRHFSKIPDNLDILITHTPPHIPDSSIDRSIQYGGIEAFGSNELTQAIYEKNPRYVFCGHIHSGIHDPVHFEKSTIYNVSRVDENYEIAYEPCIIDIDPLNSIK